MQADILSIARPLVLPLFNQEVDVIEERVF